VDQSFVQLTSKSQRDATLLEAIMTLGKNLNVTMLAEGVETSEQYARLTGLGCSMAQGFLFSPAVQLQQASALVGANFVASVVFVDEPI
jgi:EAL domain-containing protein (putative c-di-GMP-specific phosphodiesterase class I)